MSRATTFSELSLGEVQLLLLGIWIIGDQSRVDLKLLDEYYALRDQLQKLAVRKASAALRKGR